MQYSAINTKGKMYDSSTCKNQYLLFLAFLIYIKIILAFAFV